MSTWHVNKFYRIFQRYHVGKDRIVAVTAYLNKLVAADLKLLDTPSLVYKVTVYEGHSTGKLRRVIRMMEVVSRILNYYFE